jgi:VanZ family protein
VIKKIAPDKWRHFFVGIGMGVFLQSIGLWLFPGHSILVTALVFTVAVCISYGFELFSKFTGYGIYEVMDAVASIVGAVAGMGLGWLMAWFYR